MKKKPAITSRDLGLEFAASAASISSGLIICITATGPKVCR